MNVLKPLGIDKLTSGIVIKSLGILTLFGFAVNGLFDAYKLLLNFFLNHSDTPGILDFVLYLCWPVIFSLVVMHYCDKYANRKKKSNLELEVGKVEEHKGLVAFVSIAKLNYEKAEVEAINKKIKTENKEELFKIIGIGQLLKGLYYHKATLEHVWPIATKESGPYIYCLKEFGKRFMDKRIEWHESKNKNGDIIKTNESETIKETKSIVSKIYESNNLDEYGLSKSDIIVDITGGTKLMSLGFAFGALSASIDIQYVEQGENNEVIPIPGITAEIILDKFGEYIHELYLNKN